MYSSSLFSLLLLLLLLLVLLLARHLHTLSGINTTCTMMSSPSPRPPFHLRTNTYDQLFKSSLLCHQAHQTLGGEPTQPALLQFIA
jgi:hypothetical protein